MLLPLSVMAMTPISDNAMSKVTGQAGVSMTFDVTMDLTFGALGWGDSDGADALLNTTINYYTSGDVDNAGWIGIDGMKITNLHIWPRTDYTMEDGAGGDISATPTAGADRSGDGGWAQLKWLTIDVATLNSSTFAAGQFGTTFAGLGKNVTAVRIGVPTLTLTMDDLAGNVVLGGGSANATIGGIVNGEYYDGHVINAPVFDQLLGRFYVGGMNIATGGGELLIFSGGSGTLHSGLGGTLYGSGINIAMTDVKVDYILFDELAWGDIDGAFDVCATATGVPAHTVHNTGLYGGGATLSGLANPGWVGLANFAIENIEIDGVVSIQVGTYSGGVNTVDTLVNANAPDPLDPAWHTLISCFDEAFAATASQHGDSFIFIGLKGVHVAMGQMGASVQLSSNVAAPIFDGSQILGDIYVGGMDVLIKDNPLTTTKSWFAIFAH